MWQTLEKYPITVYCSPATGFRMLLRNNPDQYKFKTLRHCISGGEPVVCGILDSLTQLSREACKSLVVFRCDYVSIRTVLDIFTIK